MYPNGKDLIEIFIARLEKASEFKLLDKSSLVHFIYKGIEYFVYLKCVSYAGTPYPDNTTRAQLPRRNDFNRVIQSDARFLFLGHDVENNVYVCWEPNKAKKRLNKKSYVSFFSRKSIQECVMPGKIVCSKLTNGDEFVLFKIDDIAYFLDTIDNYFVFEEKNFNPNKQEDSMPADVLNRIVDDLSVKKLVDDLCAKQVDRLQMIASCLNEFGPSYPKMGFNMWVKIVYDYLDNNTTQKDNDEEKTTSVEIKLKKDETKAILNGETEYFVQLKSRSLTAMGCYYGDRFVVFEGSEAASGTALYENLQKRELKLRQVAHIQKDIWILDKDVTFKSPSAAAGFLFGRSSNGWVEWVDDSKRTLKELYKKGQSAKEKSHPSPKSGNKISVVTEEKSIQETSIEVQGIWSAFKNYYFRTLFFKYLVDSGLDDIIAEERMLDFYDNILEADTNGIYGVLLNSCKDFDKLHELLSQLFRTWKNSNKSLWLKKMFFDYLEFLKKHFAKHGSLSAPKTRIELVYNGGRREIFDPQEALRKVVEVIGPKNVYNIKLSAQNGKYPLISSHIMRNDDNYEKFDKQWWLLKNCSTKNKLQLIRIILHHNNGAILTANLV